MNTSNYSFDIVKSSVTPIMDHLFRVDGDHMQTLYLDISKLAKGLDTIKYRALSKFISELVAAGETDYSNFYSAVNVLVVDLDYLCCSVIGGPVYDEAYEDENLDDILRDYILDDDTIKGLYCSGSIDIRIPIHIVASEYSMKIISQTLGLGDLKAEPYNSDRLTFTFANDNSFTKEGLDVIETIVNYMTSTTGPKVVEYDNIAMHAYAVVKASDITCNISRNIMLLRDAAEAVKTFKEAITCEINEQRKSEEQKRREALKRETDERVDNKIKELMAQIEELKGLKASGTYTGDEESDKESRDSVNTEQEKHVRSKRESIDLDALKQKLVPNKYRGGSCPRKDVCPFAGTLTCENCITDTIADIVGTILNILMK